MKKVLFATDFSTASDAALTQATDLARGMHAQLVILHVEEPPLAYGGGELYYGVPEPTSAILEEMLRKVVPADPAVPVSHRMVMGDPATEIVRIAEQEQVSLIVLGTHGRSGLARLLMGSVAEQTMRHAPCPVLTIRQPHYEAAKV
jgi:universal stress protein A